MLVCHCNAQSERTIRQCIEEGARDLCEVGMKCGAGTDCGGCLPLLRELLEETLQNRSPQLQGSQPAA
jgi:bacterioferritin-associated ferredoxin